MTTDPDTEAMSPLDRLNHELSIPPYHAFLQPEAVSVDAEAGRVEVRLRYRPEFQRRPNQPGYHGGVIAGLIDLTAHAAIAVKIGHVAPTVDLRIDYLRGAGGSDLLATGTVRRAGRTLAVVDVDVASSDGKLVATGRGLFSTAS